MKCQNIDEFAAGVIAYPTTHEPDFKKFSKNVVHQIVIVIPPFPRKLVKKMIDSGKLGFSPF
jgi:hypothetical protein